MRDFKKRRSQREEMLRLGLRALGVLVLFGITALAVRGAWNMYGKLALASEAQQGAEAQLAALELQQAQVEASLGELSSSRGIEAEVRERFGVAKPGEGKIDIVRNSTIGTSTPAEPATWWGRLVRALFAW